MESKSQALLQIAQKHDISPKVIYDTIKPKSGKFAGEITADSKVSFLGRRTLEELAELDKINLKESPLFLQEKGFDATLQSQMRKAANALGITPCELFDKLKILRHF